MDKIHWLPLSIPSTESLYAYEQNSSSTNWVERQRDRDSPLFTVQCTHGSKEITGDSNVIRKIYPPRK